VAICILWRRLGSPLPRSYVRPDGTTYASGTEFEFEEAIAGFRDHGRPDFLVYRKSASAVVNLDDTREALDNIRQKEALDAFIKKWFTNEADGTAKAASHRFKDGADFERLLEEHLRKLIIKRLPALEQTAAPARLAWANGSPFRGLDVFEFEHAPIFFGRTQGVVDALTALRTNAAARHAFLLIVGVSGGGKSSLMRAGVLPMLMQPGVIEGVALWRRAVFKPSDAGGNLFRALANALLMPSALPELGADGTTAAQLAALLRDSASAAFALLKGGLSQAAAAVAREQSRPQPEARLVIALDQLEEMFTTAATTTDDRNRFMTLLGALARSGKVWIVATMRGDFYHRSFELPELVALQEGSGAYALPLPTAAELAQMILEPARAAGLKFELDPTQVPLDDILRDDAARSPESLPLLEFALNELYHASSGGTITYAAYRQSGGVEGALTKRAEAVFAALPADVQAALPRVLRALVNVSDGETMARRQATLESVAPTPAARHLVDAFVTARLFSADATPDGAAVIRVTHEALLRSWPRVTTWLRGDRELLMIRTRVAAAAARWDQEARRTDLLLPAGKPLGEAQRLERELPGELTPLEEAFIGRSTARARTGVLSKRTAIAALLVLTATALGVAIYAVRERDQAKVSAARADVSAAAALHGFSSAQKAADLISKFASSTIALDELQTKDKLLLADDWDHGFQLMRDDVEDPALSENWRLRHGNLLASSALSLFQRGQFTAAAASAARSEALLADQKITPFDAAQLHLARALEHFGEVRFDDADRDLAATADFLNSIVLPPLNKDQFEAALLAARIYTMNAQLRTSNYGYDKVENLEQKALACFRGAGKWHPSDSDPEVENQFIAGFADLEMLREDTRALTTDTPAIILHDWHAVLDDRRALPGSKPAADPSMLNVYTNILTAEQASALDPSDSAVDSATSAIDALYRRCQSDPQNLTLFHVLGRELLARSGYALTAGDATQATLDLTAARTLAYYLLDGGDLFAATRLNVSADYGRIAMATAAKDWPGVLDAASLLVGRTKWLDTELGPSNYAAENRLSSVQYIGSSYTALGNERRAIEAINHALQTNAAQPVTPLSQYDASSLAGVLLADDKLIGTPSWQAALAKAFTATEALCNLPTNHAVWLSQRAYLESVRSASFDRSGAFDDADTWLTKALDTQRAAYQADPDDVGPLARGFVMCNNRLRSLDAPQHWPQLITTVRLALKILPQDVKGTVNLDQLASAWRDFHELVTNPASGLSTWRDAPRTDAAILDGLSDQLNETGARIQAICDANDSTKPDAAIPTLDARSLDLPPTADGPTAGDRILRFKKPLGWSTTPTYGSAWRSLEGSEFAAAVSHFTAPEMRGTTLLKPEIQRIRETKLPFYENGKLLEAECQPHSGGLYLAAVLLIGNQPFKLNGKSQPIHDANAAAPMHLDTPDDAAAYIKFFGSYIAGGAGPFRIVESDQEVPWGPGISSEERGLVSRALRPFVVWQQPRDDHWYATASVIYGNDVFHAKFDLARDGMVEMQGDQPIAENVDIKQPMYVGGPARTSLPLDLYAMRLTAVDDETRAINQSADAIKTANPARSVQLRRQSAWLQRGHAEAELNQLLDAKTPPSANALAGDYLDLSWHELCCGDAAAALASTDAGLKIDPQNLSLLINRAHALLFLGRTADASAIYRSHRGEKINALPWEQNITNDLNELDRFGWKTPATAQIRELLNSGKP
jgi:tetratricopeptide (TPR) repeat protein